VTLVGVDLAAIVGFYEWLKTNHLASILDLAKQIDAKKGTCFTGFPYLSTALGCPWLEAD